MGDYDEVLHKVREVFRLNPNVWLRADEVVLSTSSNPKLVRRCLEILEIDHVIERREAGPAWHHERFRAIEE